MKLRRGAGKSDQLAGRRRPNREPEAGPQRFAYRSRRPSTSKVTQRAGNYWPQRIGLLVLVAALIVSTIKITSLSPEPKVMPLASTASQVLLRPTTEYQQAAAGLLNDSVWSKNKLTIDTGAISRRLRQHFPELASVNVTLPLLANRPIIYVKPVSPVLLLEAKSGTFVIDDGGKAISRYKANSALKELHLPILKDQSGLNIKLKQPAIPSDDIRFVSQVMAQLKNKQHAVESITLPPSANQLDIKLANQPFYIKFNLQDDDPRGQAGTFLATYELLKRKNVKPSSYIDVRVPGRAYYQ